MCLFRKKVNKFADIQEVVCGRPCTVCTYHSHSWTPSPRDLQLSLSLSTKRLSITITLSRRTDSVSQHHCLTMTPPTQQQIFTKAGFELVAILALGAACLGVHKQKPFQRGFFCDDETLLGGTSKKKNGIFWEFFPKCQAANQDLS